MANWNWHTFCGHSENFTAWTGNDFGNCFEKVVIICPVHALLAIASTFYIGQRQKRFYGSQLHVSWTWFLLLRFLTVFLLFLAPVLQLVFSVTLLKNSVSYVDAVDTGIVSLSWLLHLVFISNLRYLHNVSLRGPLNMFVIFLLTLVALSVHIRTVILQSMELSSNRDLSEVYTCFIVLGLQVLYLISLIPNKNRIYRTDLFTRNLNYDSPETEVITWDHIQSYSGVDRPGTVLMQRPRECANCLTFITFHWVQPMMNKGSKGQINSANDLFQLPNRLNTDKIDFEFTELLQSRRDVLKQKNDEIETQNHLPVENINGEGIDSEVSFRSMNRERDMNTKHDSLLRALNSAFGVQYYLLGILKLLADGFGFAGPILLNLLVAYIENKTETNFHGYLYALGLTISTFLGTICSTQFDYNSQIIGLKIRCAIISTVYKKALAVNSVSASRFSTGEIVNFMSTDTDRIVNFCPSFHAFWSLPFQIAVSLYLLHQQVGLAFLAGLAFALILVPINRQLAVKIGDLSQKMMQQKDLRVKVMAEVLAGIRVVKFYAWEDHFVEKINKLRDAELKSLKGRKYLDALCVYFWATTPVLISIITFTTFVLMGNKLTAAKVFTSLSLFLMLIGPLNAFPWVINGLMESWVSMKRVTAFFQLDNLDFEQYYSQSTSYSDPLIAVSNGTFSWQQQGEAKRPESLSSTPSPHPNTLQLTNISLNIHMGQFVGVIGKVGSGKSSLLSALLAEMTRLTGKVSVGCQESGFALVAQEAWIQHDTIRNNILFGKPYNAVKYDSLLEACALTDDLKMLPAGDCTEVGENGVTLSGGQKARISLARAIYQDKEVYLLDDPLAAVDAHVANHLYHKCIMGLLKNKTRILCTHHTKFLSKADLILVMEDGKIAKAGPPEDILSSVILNSESTVHRGSVADVDEESVCVDGIDSSDNLVEEERKEKGVVNLHVYKSYWKAIGMCLSPLILLALFFMQASRNINDWWLSYWISHSHHGNSTNTTYNQDFIFTFPSIQTPHGMTAISSSNTTEDSDISFYLTVYGCLAGANSLFTLSRAFLFAFGGICAAQVIHKHLLSSVLKAPVSFFDTTPIGRIINRFSSDLYAVDDSLPFILNIFLAQAYGILGTLVITCYGLPYFTIVLVPLSLLYYKIQHYYRHTSREIKRISSVTLSPIYAHFSETLTGLTTIRALRESNRFAKENLKRLDINQRAMFANKAAARWLDFRLQMLGVLMVTGVAFIAVLEHNYRGIDPGLVGLAISYSLSITNLLGGVVMSFTETEKQLVSVERTQEYIEDVPSEQWDGSIFVHPQWPQHGKVCFREVMMRYRPNLQNALDVVNFETEPAEKIGIVGRTGSGKSSLFLVLFRMVEIQSGEISLDGVNLAHLDLKDIRSRLAVIPQDPFLFSGSVRENLDPTNRFRDRELWTVLERCHLAEAVVQLGGLDSDVAEKGKHFSVGQRQLLCLARALLTQAKVLCIDEATASVDLETDSLIQETIREAFKDSTVLTIAHRINTILDSDRVLVMSEGQALEFAPPGVLLQKTNSLFHQLVHGRN
ncbi:ATP-binding cassette sub-family C member 10-like [Gigantopelta aegis]|uniref:ATP-binding cassette sub-family C member 10-like n=1 Tax=Gigantopelta aegis TaxID=1735272 RepID=UPI001B887DC4|nr:ATP-binding cassette sub-family C member 10-like [Gigantopelta aegis]